MNKTKIAKLVTSTVVGAGVHHVVDGIIKSNVSSDDLNSFGKFTVAAARVTIAMMASAQTKEYTDARIDEIVAAWSEIHPTESTES